MPEMPDGDNARENMAKKENIIKNRFLFVHQEPWQHRLLMRYGKDMVFMDATYKTTKYALPLFFLCVHTNVGYKVTAEFICQYEDSSSIAEALSVIQSWNPTWKPKYFMTDYSTCEIDAIEAGVYKTKTEDRRPKTEDRRPKIEDRRPKNEELINFRPFKLKAVVIRLKYFMGRYHTRNRLGLRFVV